MHDYVQVKDHVIHEYGVAQYVFNNLSSIVPHQMDRMSRLATRNFKCCAPPGRTTRQDVHPTKQLSHWTKGQLVMVFKLFTMSSEYNQRLNTTYPFQAKELIDGRLCEISCRELSKVPFGLVFKWIVHHEFLVMFVFVCSQWVKQHVPFLTDVARCSVIRTGDLLSRLTIKGRRDCIGYCIHIGGTWIPRIIKVDSECNGGAKPCATAGTGENQAV